MKTLYQLLLIVCYFTFLGCQKHSELEMLGSIQESAAESDVSVQEQVLISEILADPMQGGVEFIEIYNNSPHIIDLRSLEIASVNSSGKRNSLRRVSSESIHLYPGGYKILSKNSQIVQEQYPYQDERSFHTMESLPSLTNSQGAVLLFHNERLIDSLFYTVKMHDSFIKNTKGVSLERVDFTLPTNFPGNFVSAAATNNYATPGYRNSQAINRESDTYGVSLLNESFSPEKGETLNIHIELARGGEMVNVLIYNSAGKQVKTLGSNHRLGTKNTFSWNGENDQGRALPAGIYYVFIELYNSLGRLESFKKTSLLIR